MIVSGSFRLSLGLDLKYDHHHFEDDDHHSASVVVDIFMTRSCWLPRVRGRLWGAKAVTSKYFFAFFAFSSHICCLTSGIKIAEIPKGFVLCRKLFISHCWNHNHHNGDDHHNHHYTDGDYNDVCTSSCMQSDAVCSCPNQRPPAIINVIRVIIVPIRDPQQSNGNHRCRHHHQTNQNPSEADNWIDDAKMRTTTIQGRFLYNQNLLCRKSVMGVKFLTCNLQ